jgi:hypothetical protein
MITTGVGRAVRFGAACLALTLLVAAGAEAQALKHLGKRAMISTRVDPEECAIAAAIAAEEDPSAKAALMSKLIDMKSAKAATAARPAPSFESGGGGGGGY